MAEKQCTGDCLKCSFQQQVYCAAQRSYALMTYIPGIIERLDRIENSLPSMGEVFNPLKEEAHEDAGAENRASENNQTE